ncbi:MAG: secretin N-terminal domain-containing protein [Verrucomicrobiota bacterium]|jgi:general secretion pathway protein D
MNTNIPRLPILALVATVALGARLHGQESTPPPAAAVPQASPTDKAKADAAPAAAVAAPGTNAPVAAPKPPPEPLASPEPLPTAPDGTPMLRLNFRGAPLETVLNYLSEAAGYIIVLDTEVKGRIDAWSAQPVTRDEAFQILETALAKNGYTALRSGRTLTIVSKDAAKKRDIPVKSGNNPDSIPKDEQVVTQIIPIRFISATALTTDLAPLLPSEATMTANEAGNALVITDTQASIKRIAEIIRALDTSLANSSSIKVFALRFADAKETANVIKDLFASTDSRAGGNAGGNNGGRGGFGGFPGGFGGFPGAAMGGGGARGGASSSGAGNRAAASKVVAVADEHSNSVIVNAPEDAMPSIEDLIRSVDTNVQDITELRVFRLEFADPTEMADVLSGLFPDDTNSRSGNNANNRGQRFGGFGMFGGMNRGGGTGGATGSSSDRTLKKGKVTAVPDARTSSVIVSADRTLMPQIAEMVKQLDANPARKQQVFVYSLDNADPQQVQTVLRGLFERAGSNTRSTQGQQQQSSFLTTRSTQQQQQQNNVNRSSGFGSGAGGGGGGGRGN